MLYITKLSSTLFQALEPLKLVGTVCYNYIIIIFNYNIKLYITLSNYKHA